MDKPRYRYNHKTQEWDLLFRFKVPYVNYLPPIPSMAYPPRLIREHFEAQLTSVFPVAIKAN